MVTKLYDNILIRHAHTDGERLSEKGIRDSYDFGRRLYEWYGNSTILVTTSPVSRAVDTGSHARRGYIDAGGLEENISQNTDNAFSPVTLPEDVKNLKGKELYGTLVNRNDPVVKNTAQRFGNYVMSNAENKGTINVGVSHEPGSSVFAHSLGLKGKSDDIFDNLSGITYEAKEANGKRYLAVKTTNKDGDTGDERQIEWNKLEQISSGEISEKQNLERLVEEKSSSEKAEASSE